MGEKIKVPNTKYHKFINFLCISIIATVFLYLILGWGQFPDRIPGHYNGAGEVDRWGGKGELLLCPILSVFLYGLLTLCEKFPMAWNTGVTVTKENKERIYRILKNMIVSMKLLIVLTFAFLFVYQALARPLPGWFLPVVMLLMFGQIAYCLVQLYRKR